MLPSFFSHLNIAGKKYPCSLSHSIITPSCKSLAISSGILEGTHFLILFLKTSRLPDCLASSGTNSHILGPRNESDSVPIIYGMHWPSIKV